ncbi:MAG TPA: hypothetical protein VIK04_00665 [Solirubrobacteraceae bacterium]
MSKVNADLSTAVGSESCPGRRRRADNRQPQNAEEVRIVHRRLQRVTRPSQASDHRAVGAAPISRSDAAADAIASVRAEGLDPSRAEPLLAAWSRGDLTDAQLNELSLRLMHDRELTAEKILPGARAA